MTELVSCLHGLQAAISKESDFCVASTDRSEQFRSTLKSLFDLSATVAKKTFGPLKTLVIENLDEEAIWEELQSRNKPFAKQTENQIGKLNRKIAELIPEETVPTKSTKNHPLNQKKDKKASSKKVKIAVEEEDDDENDDFEAEEDDQEEDDDEESIYNEDDGSEINMEEYEIEGEDQDDTPYDARDEEDDDEEEGGEDDVVDQEDDEDDMEFDETRDDYVDSEEEKPSKPVKTLKTTSKSTTKPTKPAKQVKKGKKKSEYDDELAMEAWLDAYEVMENKLSAKQRKLEQRMAQSKHKNVNYEDMYDEEEEDEEDDENDLEMIQQAMYDSEGEDEDEDDHSEQSDEQIKFDDFYEREEEEDDDDDNDEEKEENEYEGEEEEEESDNELLQTSQQLKANQNKKASDNQKGKEAKFTTTYQKRAKELADQIQQLEQELMAEKAWELKGEVKATARPENSMLDLVADVDRVSKVAPTITQDYTLSLEEIISKRITDERFDDVKPLEHTVHSMTMPLDANDKSDEMELSQEKSKLGLGDIYAEEYAKQFLQSHAEGVEVKTQEAHEEILSLFNELSRELDGLTHFYYTPRAVAQESHATVLSNQRALPAMEMEDITPFGQHSYVSQQTPEEILAKKSFKKKRASLSVIQSDNDNTQNSNNGGKNNKKKSLKRKPMDALDRKVEKHLRRNDDRYSKKPFSML